MLKIFTVSCWVDKIGLTSGLQCDVQIEQPFRYLPI